MRFMPAGIDFAVPAAFVAAVPSRGNSPVLGAQFSALGGHGDQPFVRSAGCQPYVLWLDPEKGAPSMALDPARSGPRERALCLQSLPSARAARLATKPDLTGSVPTKKTIGMVVAAPFAAWGAEGPAATIGGPRRQAAILILRPAVFDRHVTALHVSRLCSSRT
jgi:hypothetical protein